MSTEVTEKANEAVSGSVDTVKAVPRTKTELRAEAARARVELAQTLDAIEYKLNLPRQVRVRSRRVTARLGELGEKSPLALAGIVLGAASAAVGAVWLGVKAVQRR
jgi:putative Ca2+/H+ antiporter (TMEM165/GDT1 family)